MAGCGEAVAEPAATRGGPGTCRSLFAQPAARVPAPPAQRAGGCPSVRPAAAERAGAGREAQPWLRGRGTWLGRERVRSMGKCAREELGETKAPAEPVSQGKEPRAGSACPPSTPQLWVRMGGSSRPRPSDPLAPPRLPLPYPSSTRSYAGKGLLPDFSLLHTPLRALFSPVSPSKHLPHLTGEGLPTPRGMGGPRPPPSREKPHSPLPFPAELPPGHAAPPCRGPSGAIRLEPLTARLCTAPWPQG